MHTHPSLFDRIARHLWLAVAVIYTTAALGLGVIIGVSAL